MKDELSKKDKELKIMLGDKNDFVNVYILIIHQKYQKEIEDTKKEIEIMKVY